MDETYTVENQEAQDLEQLPYEELEKLYEAQADGGRAADDAQPEQQAQPTGDAQAQGSQERIVDQEEIDRALGARLQHVRQQYENSEEFRVAKRAMELFGVNDPAEALKRLDAADAARKADLLRRDPLKFVQAMQAERQERPTAQDSPFERAAVELEAQGVTRQEFIQACETYPNFRDAIARGVPVDYAARYELPQADGPQTDGQQAAQERPRDERGRFTAQPKRPPIVKATSGNPLPAPDFERMSDEEFEKFSRLHDATYRTGKLTEFYGSMT